MKRISARRLLELESDSLAWHQLRGVKATRRFSRESRRGIVGRTSRKPDEKRRSPTRCPSSKSDSEAFVQAKFIAVGSESSEPRLRHDHRSAIVCSSGSNSCAAHRFAWAIRLELGGSIVAVSACHSPTHPTSPLDFACVLLQFLRSTSSRHSMDSTRAQLTRS